METKHTSGPWRVVALESTLIIASNELFGDIAKVFRDKKYVDDKDGESLANAHLIASAPSLLKENQELKASLTMICDYVLMREFDVNVLRQMAEQGKELIK